MNLGQDYGIGSLELELVLEGGFEVIHIIEVVYGIGWLGAEPFVLYQQVHNLAEITGGVDPPICQHQHGQSAPLLKRQLPEALT